MIDHISLYVTDMARSKAFYEKALAPLGYKVYMEGEGYCGMGDERGPDLWLMPRASVPSQHVGFRVTSQEQVQAFYAAALANGGKDNGAPGPRPDYGPEYYGGFVHDPDGHNIEAVVRK